MKGFIELTYSKTSKPRLINCLTIAKVFTSADSGETRIVFTGSTGDDPDYNDFREPYDIVKQKIEAAMDH